MWHLRSSLGLALAAPGHDDDDADDSNYDDDAGGDLSSLLTVNLAPNINVQWYFTKQVHGQKQ